MSLFFLIKIFFVCIWLIVVRGTLPRYRLDVLANKTWKEWVIFWVIVLLLNSFINIIL